MPGVRPGKISYFLDLRRAVFFILFFNDFFIAQRAASCVARRVTLSSRIFSPFWILYLEFFKFYRMFQVLYFALAPYLNINT